MRVRVLMCVCAVENVCGEFECVCIWVRDSSDDDSVYRTYRPVKNEW